MQKKENVSCVNDEVHDRFCSESMISVTTAKKTF